MDFTLKVRCKMSILGHCTDRDCPHNNLHDFDRSCEPGQCEAMGRPVRCTEDYRNGSGQGILIDDGVVLIQEEI